MKSVAQFILLILFASGSLYAQQATLAAKKIDAKVASIDKMKGVAVKILRDRDVSDEATDGGMTLTGYYKNDTLLRINFWVALFDGIWDCNYYYQNDSLIYASEKHKTYLVDSAKQTIDYNHTNLKGENRFYIDNGKLVKKYFGAGAPDADLPDEKIVAEVHKYVDDYYMKLKKADTALKPD